MIAKGHKHGYEMIKHLEENHRMRISAANLYTVLDRLDADGYIKGRWEHEDGKPDKRVYTITPKGKMLFKLAKNKLKNFITDL